MRRASLFFLLALVLIPLAGCSSPTELHGDIAAARMDWMRMNARDYVFEVSIITSWTPRSGFYRVRVVNRQVTEAFEPDGSPAQGFTLTLDRIWDEILASQMNDEINSVSFDTRGVPIHTDLGPWASDGGRGYSVRRFARQR